MRLNRLLSRDWGWPAMVAGLGVMLASALWALYLSRNWLIVHDIPLLQYVAQRLLMGEAPYRNHLDMPFPVFYAIHALEQLIFGESDAGFRLFDFLWMSATCAAIAALLRKEGWFTQLAAVALFVIACMSQGNIGMGQRDYLMCLFVVLAAHQLLRYLETEKDKPLLLCGLFLGTLCSMKPSMGVLAVLFALYLLRVLPWRGAVRRMLLLAAGGAVMPVLMALWLWYLGALAAFVDMTLHYTMGFYFDVGRQPLSHMLRRVGDMAAPFLAVFLLPSAPSNRAHLIPVVFLCACASAAHAVLQAKGFSYHFFPLQLCLSLLAGIRAGGYLAMPWRKNVYVLAWLFMALNFSPANMLYYDRDPWNIDRIYMLMEDIKKHSKPADKVQVVDMTWGGYSALYRLHMVQPTRIMNDFFFYLPSSPQVDRLRQEFMDTMRAASPQLIVVAGGMFPVDKDGIYRTKHFPALQKMIDEKYHAVETKPGWYVVYKRK